MKHRFVGRSFANGGGAAAAASLQAPERIKANSIKVESVDSLLNMRDAMQAVLSAEPKNSAAYKAASANLNVINKELGRDLGIKGNASVLSNDEIGVLSDITINKSTANIMNYETLLERRDVIDSLLETADPNSVLFNTVNNYNSIINNKLGKDFKLSGNLIDGLSSTDVMSINNARSNFSLLPTDEAGAFVLESTLTPQQINAINNSLTKNINNEEKRLGSQLTGIHRDEIQAIKSFGQKYGLSKEEINRLVAEENAANKVEKDDYWTSRAEPGFQNLQFVELPLTEEQQAATKAALSQDPNFQQLTENFGLANDYMPTFANNVYDNGLFSALETAYNVPEEKRDEFRQALTTAGFEDYTVPKSIQTETPLSSRTFIDELPDAGSTLDAGINFLNELNAPSSYKSGKTSMGFNTFKAGIADLNRDENGNIQFMPEFRIGTSGRGAQHVLLQLGGLERASTNPELSDKAKLISELPDGTKIYSDTIHKWKKGGAQAAFAVSPDVVNADGSVTPGQVAYLGGNRSMTPTGGGGFLKKIGGLALAALTAWAAPQLAPYISGALGTSNAISTALASGLLSGVRSELTGGDFGRGFLAGGLGSYAGDLIGGLESVRQLQNTFDAFNLPNAISSGAANLVGSGIMTNFDPLATLGGAGAGFVGSGIATGSPTFAGLPLDTNIQNMLAGTGAGFTNALIQSGGDLNAALQSGALSGTAQYLPANLTGVIAGQGVPTQYARPIAAGLSSYLLSSLLDDPTATERALTSGLQTYLQPYGSNLARDLFRTLPGANVQAQGAPVGGLQQVAQAPAYMTYNPYTPT